MTELAKSYEYIRNHRAETIAALQKFFATDTLLFWSDNPNLYARQKKQWQPLFDTFAQKYSLHLRSTTSLSVPENDAACTSYCRLLETLSDKCLTVCFLASAITKSVLIGCLLAQKEIDASTAFKTAFLEELYQNEQWGEDAEVLSSRQKIKDDLAALENFLP